VLCVLMSATKGLSQRKCSTPTSRRRNVRIAYPDGGQTRWTPIRAVESSKCGRQKQLPTFKTPSKCQTRAYLHCSTNLLPVKLLVRPGRHSRHGQERTQHTDGFRHLRLNRQPDQTFPNMCATLLSSSWRSAEHTVRSSSVRSAFGPVSWAHRSGLCWSVARSDGPSLNDNHPVRRDPFWVELTGWAVIHTWVQASKPTAEPRSMGPNINSRGTFSPLPEFHSNISGRRSILERPALHVADYRDTTIRRKFRGSSLHFYTSGDCAQP